MATHRSTCARWALLAAALLVLQLADSKHHRKLVWCWPGADIELTNDSIFPVYVTYTGGYQAHMDPDNNSPLGPVGPGETITIHSSWMYEDNNYDIDDAIDLEITKADTMPPHHTPYSGTMTVKVVEIDYLQRLQMAAVARDAQLNVVTTRRGIGGWMCTDFSTTKVRVTLSPNGR